MYEFNQKIESYVAIKKYDKIKLIGFALNNPKCINSYRHVYFKKNYRD